MAYVAMQHGRNGRLPRQSLENFKAALERPHFAVRELADAAFERGVGRRRAVQPLAPLLGEPERKARHIEKGYEKRGVSHKEAEHRAWATVNKQDK